MRVGGRILTEEVGLDLEGTGHRVNMVRIASELLGCVRFGWIGRLGQIAGSWKTKPRIWGNG